MIDQLWSAGASNLFLSSALALIAAATHRWGGRPAVAHLLWLLVLAKLVTPPLVALPVLPLPDFLAAAEAVPAPAEGELLAAPLMLTADMAPLEELGPSPLALAGRVAALLWLLGSVALLVVSGARIVRFGQLLREAAQPAPPAAQNTAEALARRLGLARTPRVVVTPARLSPLVWWAGGRPCVVLPAELVRALPSRDLRLILAHELAHIRRRDHMVRWLEWLACVVFWWNPISWWARRNLRAAEEVCCDALVLASLRPDPRAYASSLLNAVELLAPPAPRPPAVVSALHDGGFLERRLRMIVSDKPFFTAPRWMRALAIAGAAGLLPLGVAGAQHEHEHREKTKEQQTARIDEYKQEAVEKLRRAMAEVEHAHAAGKLSAEEAKKRLAKLHAMLDEVRVLASKKAPREAKLERAAAELKAAVAAGKMSADAAEAKLSAMRKALAEQQAALELEAAVQQIREAIAAGQLSSADGDKKLAEIKSKLAHREAKRGELARVETELHKLVAAGQISKEDAERRLKQAHEAAGAIARVHKMSLEDYLAGEAQIRDALAAGKVQSADAEARLAEMRSMVVAGHQGSPVDDARIRSILAAVQHGKLSNAEGKSHIEEYLKGLATKPRADASKERTAKLRSALADLEKQLAEGKTDAAQAKAHIAAIQKELAKQQAEEARKHAEHFDRIRLEHEHQKQREHEHRKRVEHEHRERVERERREREAGGEQAKRKRIESEHRDGEHEQRTGRR
ncbi:MAG: M56 family metallopeptidase [Planctomycetota bacterium]